MTNGFKTRKIVRVKGLGQRLREKREKMGMSLLDAEGVTKVRTKYLQALEESRFEDLPADAYSMGFLRRYARFLKLDPDKMVGLFKAERGTRVIPFKVKSNLEENKMPQIIITPKVIIWGLVILVFIVLASYIWFQAKNLTAPPPLEIFSPALETQVNTDSLEIVGKSDETATILINNEPVEHDEQGNFKTKVSLNPGVNIIQVIAANRFQKKTVKTIKILAQF